MKFIKYLANLGYGSRREVERLFKLGAITGPDGELLNPGDPFAHSDVRVNGEPLDVAPGSALMLNKPIGYVCSTKEASQLIYELLPSRFRDRSPVIAPIGRLDRDTSGLLLLTDDGQLNHRVTSPKSQLAKVYQVSLASPLRGDEAAIFERGTLMLESETAPLKPVMLRQLDESRVEVTLTEGRYHQVRRMFAAVGNHVHALHRTSIGALQLGDLPSGSWRPLDDAEVQSISGRG